MATNLLLSGKARLLQLIQNSSWRAGVSEDKIDLGLPVVVTLHDRNTRLVITPKANQTAIPGKDLKGKRTIYYNRLSLSTVFPDGIVIPELPLGVTQAHDLIPALEEAGVKFLPEDIVNSPVSALPFTLQAAPNSYGWIGSVSVHQGGGTVMNSILLDGGGYFLLDSGSVLLTG